MEVVHNICGSGMYYVIYVIDLCWWYISYKRPYLQELYLGIPFPEAPNNLVLRPPPPGYPRWRVWVFQEPLG